MTLPLAPGDLTLRQIAATFSAMQRIRDLALEGFSEGEIALELDWRREDVRTAARIVGLSTSTLAPKPTVCPKCGYPREWVSPKTGFCLICAKKDRQERMLDAYEEEERLVDQRENKTLNRLKKDLERLRDDLDTNPRKKTKTAFIVEWAESPAKVFEEVIEAVEECRLALQQQ